MHNLQTINVARTPAGLNPRDMLVAGAERFYAGKFIEVLKIS
jgi:hypothetical protein